MKIQLLMSTVLILFATTLTLADDKESWQFAEQPSEPDSAKKQWKLEDGPGGKLLKEVEEIRKQLGSEFSIESKELGIERDQSTQEPTDSQWQTTNPWPGTKLYQEVRELVGKYRRDARHLEEMAAEAEQISDFALADQLRGIARHHWETARELSKPGSTRHYHQPGVTDSYPPATYAPRRVPASNVPAPYQQQPDLSSPVPQYAPPAQPGKHFSIPESKKPKDK